jgi:hypothetical protein
MSPAQRAVHSREQFAREQHVRYDTGGITGNIIASAFSVFF